MTNIATNTDGSMTITLPAHVTEWGIDPIRSLIWAFAVLMVGIGVWIIARRTQIP
jgi:hypothetical protein